MTIRRYKPTSPGRRFQTVQTFDEITATKPYKPLTEPLPKSGGRNNRGRVTSWQRGGGHKRTYRIIDFKRDKRDVPGRVSTVEYDPNRSARIALVTYADGEKRYIIQPVGVAVGDTVIAGDHVDILPGNALPLKNIPLGTQLHNVELRPGKGGQNRAERRIHGEARGQGGQVRLSADAVRRSASNLDGVFGDGGAGRQRRSRERVARQGRSLAVARASTQCAWRCHEPGGSPARRR